MAPKESRSSPGRSEPGKLKIGGDLQGEPIFCLSGPAAALGVPIRKAAVVAGNKQKKGRSGRKTEATESLIASGQRRSGDTPRTSLQTVSDRESSRC